MRSIPIDDLLNVGIDGGFNSKNSFSKFQYFHFFFHLALQATIVTIQELKQYIANGDSNDTFIVQCVLTHFDLDGPLNQIITKRW
jgi:hypothetical protein